MKKNKVLVRIKGGLGNQLFCYAAARRLALVNNAELVIDDVTGFKRDHKYKRQYMLDRFNIKARKATSAERLEPFDRYQRIVLKWLSSRKPFKDRRYFEHESEDYDERLLTLKVKGAIYLDAYFQSEEYFKDVEEIIREDLRITPPTDDLNKSMAAAINNSHSVAIHVRWFNLHGTLETHNVSSDYYQRAISLIEKKLISPHYFLFSDDPEAAREKIVLPEGRVTFISHNQGDEKACYDLWLMSQCRHFITANSTFSWWGAWLGSGSDKIVVCPNLILNSGSITSWNFPGQIPGCWLRI